MADDVVGKRFNQWTVLSEDTNKEEEIRKKYSGSDNKYKYSKWIVCRCDCGTIKTLEYRSVIYGKTKSCGCLKSKDLTGMTINNLNVLGVSPDYTPKSGRHKYWRCECKLCGKIVDIRSSYLADKSAKDCGCMLSHRLSESNAIDLTGKKFGHLIVVRRDMSVVPKSGSHAKWVCKCDLCGREESVDSDVLRLYGKDRCHQCISMPLGELQVAELLDSVGFIYKHDSHIDGCVYPNSNGICRFDFVVTNRTNMMYVIEFDGVQHFKVVSSTWEASCSFEERRKRDQFKNKWCKEHSIPIIRIPYTSLGMLTADDIIPNTSKYLVT